MRSVLWTMRAASALAVVCAALVVAPAVAGAYPGQHLWSDTVHTSAVLEDDSAAALTIGRGGHPIVVGSAVSAAGGAPDIRCVSYDGPTPLWRWTTVPLTWGAGGADTACGVVQAGGADYVVGTTQTASADYVLLKLDDITGSVLWATYYDGAGKADEAEAVAADAAGNVYVTGGSIGGAGTMDIATVKVRPDGSVAWARRFDSPAHQLDRGLAIAVQGSSVYVAGISRRPEHADDIVILKYSLGGTRQWARYYDDPLHRSESVGAIAADAGGVYVCGGGKATAKAPGDALLVKYSPAGALQWAAWAGGPAGNDSWNDVAFGTHGRLHVTGSFFSRATASDIATSVYTAAGAMKWRRLFSSSGRRPEAGTSLAVDASGRTYVAGNIENNVGNADVAVLAYSAPGTMTLWWSRYPDPLGFPAEPDRGDDYAADIALTGGAVYVAGAATMHDPLGAGGAGGLSLDFLTLKLER
jgi:hypothetical protein